MTTPHNGSILTKGVGVQLNGERTAAEAISAARLDWEIEQRDLFTRQSSLDHWKAITRADTNETFAILTEHYEPLQNREAFDFCDAMIAQGEAIFDTAGSFFGGRKVWILLKLPNDIRVIPGDTVQPYILLSNSHDGTQALRVMFCPVRIVCSNTLSYVLRQGGGFKAKHTKNVLNRAVEARELLELGNAYYEIFARQVDRLVNTRMTVLDVQKYLQDVYEFNPNKSYAEQDYRRKASYESTLNLLNHPTNTVGGIAGTQWAALNAVTYYLDHERPVKGASLGDDVERRLSSTWFGRSADVRQRAYGLLNIGQEQS